MEAGKIIKVEDYHFEEEIHLPISLELPSYSWTSSSLKAEIKCEDDIKIEPESSVEIEEEVKNETVEIYHQSTSQSSTNSDNSVLDTVTRPRKRRHCDATFDPGKEQVIQCTDCMNLLPPEHLQENLIFSHVGGQDFRCPFCSSKYKYHFQLTRHLPSHFEHKITSGQPILLKCTLCPNTFTSVKELMEHRVIHSERSKLKCTECYQHLLPEDLVDHMSKDHPDVNFVTPQLNSKKKVTKLSKINKKQSEHELILPNIQNDQSITEVQNCKNDSVVETGLTAKTGKVDVDTPNHIQNLGAQGDIKPSNATVKKRSRYVCCPCTTANMRPEKFTQVICFQHLKVHRYGEEPVNFDMKELP